MSLHSRFFACTYDRFIGKTERAGLRDLRAVTVPAASGRVLEIGAGTGANIPFYSDAVESLTITEPDPHMLKRLERRLDRQATVLRAPAEDLPFDDDSFDTVVCTLVLCGVDDQPRALREIRRVLRPGGTLVFLEHVRAEDPKVARLQDRMNGVNRVLARCNCNRPTLSSIEAAGFDVTSLEHGLLPKAPPFVRPLIVGTATA